MKMIRLVLASALALALNGAMAQAWDQGGNNVTTPGDYLGCDGASTVPLKVMNNANNPIQFYTQGLERMKLWHTLGSTINGFANVKQNGYVGISDQPRFFDPVQNAAGPFSRLHLADSCDNDPNHYVQQYGYRPWMRNGVTFTGNQDQGYIGQKYNGVLRANDSTDMVLQWSDNPDYAQWGTDRLRFLFTNAKDLTKTYGAKSLEGLESFRVFVPNDTSSFVGIGDFYRASKIAGTPKDPTERLHVTDGTIRIDSLIHDYHNDTLHQVLMSDMTGKVFWRNINTWPPTGGGGGCEWGSDSPTGRIYTAFQANGSNGTCPEEDWKVGIGQPWPAAKLDVKGKQSMIGATSGVNVAFSGAAGVGAQQIGVAASVDAETTIVPNPVGVQGTISKVGTTGYAIQGTANVNASGVTSTGTSAIYGRVNASVGSTSALYGTRGEVSNTGTSMSTGSAYGAYGNVSGTATMLNVYGLSAEAKPGGSTTNSYGASAISQWQSGSSVANSTGLFTSSAPASGGGSIQKSYGVRTSASAGTTETYGVQSYAFGTGTGTTMGVYGAGQGSATTAYGVNGRAANSGTGAGITRYGVYGSVAYDNSDQAANNYSVYGDNGGGGSNQWAGYFAGRTYCAGTVFIPSDEQLKTNIQELPVSDDDPVNKLLHLTPRSYDYRTDEFPQMGLPTGHQFGFLAQEVEEAFPDMVTNAIHPAKYDSTGVEISAAVEFKALSTVGLLPLAIAAIQRQNQRIDQLQEMLMACCASGSLDHRALQNTNAAGGSIETDLRIIPNPVADQTVLRYTLGNAGRVRLEIADGTGRTIQAQDEGSRSAGAYAYDWNTTLLAPGTYFCTLLVDDVPLVKKAVKLNAR